MAVNSAMPPFFTFTDGNGLPLENGYIYIGQPGFEARTTPKASFFNLALTIPTGTASGAAIRTRGGFPVNQSNAPATFYVDGDYSISVCDRNGVLLYSALSMTFALNVGAAVGPILASDGNLAAPGISFLDETSTGFSRNNAASIQVSAGGVLVATLTSTGTTFAQPTSFTGLVSGAGFSSGVLAIAQAKDDTLTSLSGLALVQGDLLYATAADTLARLPKGTASQFLKMNSGATAPEWVTSSITSQGLLTTTGATTVGPWDIPAGVKAFRITSRLSSLSGTNHILVQLRVGGSFVTTGYTSSSISGTSGNTGAITAGMAVAMGGAAVFWDGTMDFTLHDPATNLWLSTHDGRSSTSPDVVRGSGGIALAGAVDGVRITVTGADTFDVSSFNVHLLG